VRKEKREKIRFSEICWDSLELLDYIRHQVDKLFKTLEKVWHKEFSIVDLREMSMGDFKKTVKQLSKKYPTAKIKAWAFLYEGEEDKKPKIWSFNKE